MAVVRSGTPVMAVGLAHGVDLAGKRRICPFRTVPSAKTNGFRIFAQLHASESASMYSKRALLLSTGLAAVASLSTAVGIASAASIQVIEDVPGAGTHAVGTGDLVLIHYTGLLAASEQVFDSTKGGLTYRDGGQGVYRPIIIRQGGDPVPGICAGLQQGLEGMRVGGVRTFEVPAELGFGSQTVLAPYAVVPGGSRLRYTVELLRVSTVGPDALMKGISRCGKGGMSEAADGCKNIQLAEFL